MTNWLESHAKKSPQLCNSVTFSVHWGRGLVLWGVLPPEVFQYALGNPIHGQSQPPVVTYPLHFSGIRPWLYFTERFFKGLLELCFITRWFIPVPPVSSLVYFLNHWIYAMLIVTSASHKPRGHLSKVNMVRASPEWSHGAIQRCICNQQVKNWYLRSTIMAEVSSERSFPNIFQYLQALANIISLFFSFGGHQRCSKAYYFPPIKKSLSMNVL